MRNKRIYTYVLSFIVCILVVSLVTNFAFQYQRKEKELEKEKRILEEIKSAFNKEVQTTSEKKIYQKKKDNYQEVGVVNKGIFLPLEENEIKTSQDRFFKIKGIDYYVDYQNLKKISHVEDNSLKNFVPTKTIKTIKTNLYKEESLAFSISDSLDLDVLLISNGAYYVSFLGEIYYIKDYFTLEERKTDTLLKEVSVFKFAEDISKEKLEEALQIFQEKGYTCLTKDEFSYWVNGLGSILEKKIFLIGDDLQSEKWKDVLLSNSFSMETSLDPYYFHEGDQQIRMGDQMHYHYLISNNTSRERIEEMLVGIPQKKQSTKIESVAVLNYHFFYDASTESCNESICLSTENFREQLSYLKENGYKTLTMQEFYNWKMGKSNIPKKSVLLTIDDGAMGTDTHLPAILEEYQAHASLFLITGWWDISKYQKTPYLEIYSHGDELHHNNYCVKSNCGYKTLKLSKDEIVADLKLSLSKGVGKLAFCYPFYQTSKTMEAALKEVGIPLAFAGGNKKVTRNVSNYYIPRYVVYKGTSINQFIRMISSE